MSLGCAGVVILGVGNELLRDDGVGVRVVRELERRAAAGEVALPAGTSILDGGTLGSGLLPFVAGARALVVVDAAELGAAPGSVRVVRGAALFGGPAGRGSAGLADLVAGLVLAGMPREAIALVGIQPAEVGVGLELSEAVANAVPAAATAALAQLRMLLRPSAPRPSRAVRAGIIGMAGGPA